jgi:hypothetical protein
MWVARAWTIPDRRQYLYEGWPYRGEIAPHPCGRTGTTLIGDTVVHLSRGYIDVRICHSSGKNLSSSALAR